MSRTLHVPTFPREFAELKQRLFDLERKIHEGGTVSSGGGSSAPEVLWEVPGNLQIGRSHNYKLRMVCSLTRISGELGTAGTTATTLAVRKNAAVVAAFTVAAGATSFNFAMNVAFVLDDRFAVGITSVGTSAANLFTQSTFTL